MCADSCIRMTCAKISSNAVRSTYGESKANARGNRSPQIVCREQSTSLPSSANSSTQKLSRRRKPPLALKPPPDWRSTWNLIVELRADRTAVVDYMGTEAIAMNASRADRAYHTLISLMLSSQTRDKVNTAVMTELQQHGLSIPSILATPDDRLNELIYPVSFRNRKVKYIKDASAILQERHGGKVPDTMDEIMALPGVGSKMALLLLRIVFGKVEGISVDTHVHRISQQLGWTGPGGTSTPEKTRQALESWMPREIWADVNLLLVGLGQEVQTDKRKLLLKCLEHAKATSALRLVSRLGLDVRREATKAGLKLPTGFK